MTETDSDITRGYNAETRDYDSITRSYRREREGDVIDNVYEREIMRMRGRLGNRFRLIRKRMKRRMKRRKRNSSKSSPFSMTISITIISISTFNLNLTLFEPHPTPPFHSPRNPHSPLSSPYPLSPHSIPLVTFNFTSRHL